MVFTALEGSINSSLVGPPLKVQKVAKTIVRWLNGNWKSNPAIHIFVDGMTSEYTSGYEMGACPEWEFKMYVGDRIVRSFKSSYVGGSGLDIWGLTGEDEEYATFFDYITSKQWP